MGKIMTKNRRKSNILSTLEVTQDIKDCQRRFILRGIAETVLRYENYITDNGLVEDSPETLMKALVLSIIPPYLREKHVTDSSFLWGTDDVEIYPHEQQVTSTFIEVASPFIYDRYLNFYSGFFRDFALRKIRRQLNHFICKPIKEPFLVG